MNGAFIENFDSDTNFIYDNTKVEFVNGELRQKDQRPINSILGATYTNDINLNWGVNGFVNLNANVIGSPSVIGGILQIPLGNNAVYYQDALIGSVTTDFSLKFEFYPGYSGSPGSNVQLISFYPPAGTTDRLYIYHRSANSNIKITTNGLNAIDFALWNPTAGQKYIFELICISNVVRLYIDGAQLGGAKTISPSRGTTATRLYLGASPFQQNSDGEFDNVILYTSAAQDINYIVPEATYTKSIVELPFFQTTSNFVIRNILTFLEDPTGSSLAYNIKTGLIGNYKYWNVSSWEDSNGTEAQANSSSIVNSNIGSFSDVYNENLFRVKLFFTNENNTQTAITQISALYETLYTLVGNVRSMLEGYCINESTVTDDWIQNRISNYVIPTIIEKRLGVHVDGRKPETKYINGTGKDIIFLPDKNVIEVTKVTYVNVNPDYIGTIENFELIPGEGILKAKYYLSESFIYPVFPKGTRNIKVTYTVGYNDSEIPEDLNELIGYLTVIEILKWIEGRSGGGNVSTQAFNRQYGNIGKYTNIRRQIMQNCKSIIRNYATGVV